MPGLIRLIERGRRLFRNARLDLRYGALLGGVRKTPYAHLGVQDTANTDYEALPWIFKDGIKPSDILVDLGCGKGRVINWWLSQGLQNRIVGIELDELVAKATGTRLRRYKNVEIIHGDVLAHLPQEGTIFYLFNPFDKPWVAALKDQLSVAFDRQCNQRIFYYNCIHVEIFENDAQWHVEKRISPDSRFHPLALITLRNKADGELMGGGN